MPYVIVSSIFRAVELKHRYLRVLDYPKIPLGEELSDHDKIEYAVSQIMLFDLFIVIGGKLWD